MKQGTTGAGSAQALPTLKKPRRVLLVEDNFLFAEATADFLRESGLEVRVASSGAEAVRIAIEFRPDVVLCDLSLPGISGLNVLRVLRANPVTKHARLALHSAMSDLELKVLQRENVEGVNIFLSKPLTPEKLERLLGTVEAQSSRSRR